MSNKGHILEIFDADLQELKDDAMKMASLSQQNLATALKGLFERNDDLCNQVIADDSEVNDYEKLVDKEGTSIIAKYSPMGTNLRRVISTMKMAQSIERVSDQAKNVAKRARKINKASEIPETTMVQPLYEIAIKLVADAVKAFAEGDVAAAVKFDERDEELDRAHKGFVKRLTKRMEDDPHHLKDYVDLMFIARFLERVGDYAVNIAEDAVYAESAYDIRHGGELPKQTS